MKRILTILLLEIVFLLLASVAFGQGTQFSSAQSPVMKNTGAALQAVPGATITVCTSTGAGIPCTPHAAIFSDLAMATPITGSVVTADGNGNFSFVALGGSTYFITVQGPGLIPYTFYWTPAVLSGSAL
jgi:hypothetical protein